MHDRRAYYSIARLNKLPYCYKIEASDDSNMACRLRSRRVLRVNTCSARKDRKFLWSTFKNTILASIVAQRRVAIQRLREVDISDSKAASCLYLL